MAKTTSVSRKNQENLESFEPKEFIVGDDTVRDTKEQQELDKKMIRGTFRFYERPNGTHSFVSHRYPGEKYRTIRLKDGHTYELPWGIVRQLEDSSYYMSHNIEESPGSGITQGIQTVHVTKKGIARFAFIPAV